MEHNDKPQKALPVSSDPRTPSVGAFLKAARRRGGMTQVQLAGLSALSVRTLRDLELDTTRKPRPETLRLLLDNLPLSKVQRAEIEAAVQQGSGLDAYDDAVPPPAPFRNIVGREHDIVALTSLVQTTGNRLVQVRGIAGVGKTRLIQEVMSSVHTTSRTAVAWTASLNPVRSSADKPVDLLTGFIQGETDLDTVVAHVGSTDVVLVVTEHEAHKTVDGRLRILLERCPRLRVIQETRRPSSLFGAEYFVAPLGVSDPPPSQVLHPDAPQPPALQLMLSRCPQQGADIWTFTRTMAGICWYLDGIPRALESAATWLPLYHPRHLLTLVRQDPYQVTGLAGTASDDLREAMDTLCHSLSPDEFGTLRALARLSGPWTIEEAVAALGAAGRVGIRDHVHRLWVFGLIRLVDRPHQQADVDMDLPRFIVLNLVRHLVEPGGESSIVGINAK